MSDEQWLRDALADAVPTPPPGGDRGPAARAAADRTRRTRTRLAVAGVAAAVVAAVAVPTLWPGGDGASPTPTPAVASSRLSPGPSSGPVDLTCPPAGSDPRPTGPDTVREGAVTARLCPVGGIGWQAPRDALTTGLDDLIGTIRGLDRDTVPVRQEACPADLGRTFAVVLGHPDGTTQTVTGELFGCHLLRVGGARYVDADSVWDTYRLLLRAQRADSPAPPPGAPADLSCDTRIDSGPGVGVIGGPADLTTAAYCWRPEALTTQHWSSATLTTGQLARLTTALTDPANRIGASIDPCDGSPRVQTDVVGYDDWGDRIAVDGECDVFYVDDHQVRLPDGVQAILDGIRQASPTRIAPPGVDAAPDVVVEGWADLLANGQTADADALWVDPAAAPAHRPVDLKVEESARRDPAADPATSAYASAWGVTALFRVTPAQGAWVDYHEYAFTLVRNSSAEPWRLLSARDLGVAHTGR